MSLETTHRVQRLPNEVAERIAAGEVVDRPSSIVKELVENSLDAGASLVEVELVDGGRELIRVTDDGHGMVAEDAKLALERHATSKLRSWEDLDSLQSFGFRGEALPSVAAVSRFELITTARGQTAGTRVTMDGPGVIDATPSAGPQGTRIDVRDLFWNTPARRKFLKSASGESMAVSELMTRFAVLNPEVGFRLSINGKEKLFYPQGMTQAQRLARHWKLEESDLLAFHGINDGLVAEGVLAKPSHHRRNRTAQILAVNGRIIRSQRLSQAFVEGFDPLVPRGRQPYVFVNLSVDPSLVDVNVHPTKAEVRFANERQPFSAIYRAIRQCLDEQRAETIKESQWTSALTGDQPLASSPTLDPTAVPEVLVTGKSYRSGVTKSAPLPRQESRRPEFTDRVMELYRPPAPSPGLKEDKSSDSGQGLLPDATPVEETTIRYLTRLYRSYLVMEVDQELWVIDQHAAHERIGYERLHRFQILGAESQGLVVPIEIQLDSAERIYLEEHSQRFSEVGFTLELSDEGAQITSVPPGLKEGQVSKFFSELLAELLQDNITVKDTPVEQYREKLRAMMACKSSIRARENITELEAKALVRNLLAAERSPYCPHGRPTRIRLDEATLERLFHRS